jgi:hypothetical protein
MAFLGAIPESAPTGLRPCTLPGETPRVVSVIAVIANVAVGARVIEEPEVKVARAA